MKVARKIWAVLLGLAAISWFSEAVHVINDPKYVPSRFDMVFGLGFIACALVNWAIEEWLNSEK